MGTRRAGTVERNSLRFWLFIFRLLDSQFRLTLPGFRFRVRARSKSDALAPRAAPVPGAWARIPGRHRQPRRQDPGIRPYRRLRSPGGLCRLAGGLPLPARNDPHSDRRNGAFPGHPGRAAGSGLQARPAPPSRHLAIDLLPTVTTGTTHRTVSFAIIGANAIFAFVEMVYGSFNLGSKSLATGKVSPSLRLSMGLTVNIMVGAFTVTAASSVAVYTLLLALLRYREARSANYPRSSRNRPLPPPAFCR